MITLLFPATLWYLPSYQTMNHADQQTYYESRCKQKEM